MKVLYAQYIWQASRGEKPQPVYLSYSNNACNLTLTGWQKYSKKKYVD